MTFGIAAWLEELGLGRYRDAFIDNDIDLDILADLDDADLEKLGVSLGHRKRMLRAIAGMPDGLAASGSVAEVVPAGTTGEAERRHMTVLFIDIVGSTDLSTRLDPEDVREFLRRYQDIVAGEITRFGGHVAKFYGDGVLCYFGWPKAHEHDAERAVRASLSIMGLLTDLTTPYGESVGARAGLSSGLVVVGDLVGEGAAQEEMVIGETPNMAARLQDKAQPGEVVVSAPTRRLLGEMFDLEPLGAQTLKGITDPVEAFVVRGERELTSRFEAHHGARLSEMVGRTQELGLLTERWGRAVSGEGQVVLLSGEAGIGKSRLTRGFIDQVAAEDHLRVRYQCSPYHVDSALHPAIQQLRWATEIAATDTTEQRLDKLEAVLARSSDRVDQVAPLMAAMMGIDGRGRYGPLDLNPQQQRTRTLQAIAEQLAGLARHQPLLFVVEDAHWIDPTTLELLDLSLDLIADSRIFLLVTARPTFEHRFGGHPIVTSLALNRLGRDQMTAIALQMTGGKALPAEVLAEIAAKTDGVPLFVEELTKTVLESGLLRETDDAFVLDRPLEAVSIPESLHDSLMARLDRMEPVKEVAQIAACIGREFAYPLVSAVAPLGDDDLTGALERLVEAELLFRRGRPPEATYLFKHALVRDAAYESLLRGRRRQLHASILGALEEDHGDPEVLAHHATQAGLTEKAFGYWRRAGDVALDTPAYREAVSHLRAALRLVPELGSDVRWQRAELETRILLGQALIAAEGYGAAPTAEEFGRALTLAESLADTEWLFPALYGVWADRYIRSEPAPELAARFMEAAAAASDTGARLVALRVLGLERFHEGRFEESLGLFDEIVAGYDPETHGDLAARYAHDARAAGLCYRGWAKTQLGYPEAAIRAIDEAVAWAKELGHGNTLGYAMSFGSLVPLAIQRDAAAVERRAAEAVAVSDDLVMSLWRAFGKIFLGWSQAWQGSDGAGIATMEEGFAEARATGNERLMPFLFGLSAEAHWRQGDRESAARSMEDAFASLAKTRDMAWEAGLLCGRGEFLTANPATVEAGVADMEQALALASERKARWIELRTATALAGVWRQRGRTEEAVALLGPVKGWFSEGFDTLDFRNAAALLDELG